MPTTTYTTIDGQIVSENRAGTQKFYGPDPLGSVVTIYDTTGTVTDTFTYWPYGEIRTSTGSTATPFKFCGTWGYYSDATGRLYIRARFYRDKIARWQTVDPLWPNEPGYLYASSTPTMFADPSGKQTQDQLKAMIEALPKDPNSVWNNPPIRYYNNCYSYGCDHMFPGNDWGTILPQPGGGCDPCSCRSVMAAIARDGFITPRPRGKKCPSGTFTVILFVKPTPECDYHLARSLPNGKWCDKHGNYEVCEPFDDPYEHNRRLGYTVVCEHYCGKVKR